MPAANLSAQMLIVELSVRELIPTSAATPGMACQLMLAVNKVDLMPKSCSRARLEVHFTKF